eukprot:5855028-Pyramimonas_sp.AAC.1
MGMARKTARPTHLRHLSASLWAKQMAAYGGAWMPVVRGLAVTRSQSQSQSPVTVTVTGRSHSRSLSHGYIFSRSHSHRSQTQPQPQS